MKKKICSLMLAVALTFQAVSFRAESAHAVMAAVTGDVGGIVGGVSLTLMGVGMVSGGIAIVTQHNSGEGFIFIGVGAMVLLIGIIVLDEDTHSLSFNTLSEEVITGAQLTEDEIAAYHLELPEVNHALYAGAADLAAQGYTTVEEAMVHPEFVQARAANLMPETRSALTKLGAYAQSRMAAAQ